MSQHSATRTPRILRHPMPTAVHRIEVRPRGSAPDPRGDAVFREAAALGLSRPPTRVETAAVYLIEGGLAEEQIHRLADELFADPLTETATIGAAPVIESLAVLFVGSGHGADCREEPGVRILEARILRHPMPTAVHRIEVRSRGSAPDPRGDAAFREAAALGLSRPPTRTNVNAMNGGRSLRSDHWAPAQTRRMNSPGRTGASVGRRPYGALKIVRPLRPGG